MEKSKIAEYATVLGAALVLAYLAYVAAVGLYEIDNFGTISLKQFSGGEYETIKVYGRQFAWVFEYPNGTQTINELIIERGKLYRLELTSIDVVHAFYIKELGIKYDTVPGFTYVLWLKVDKPGTYNVYCNEYCGVGHYLMVGKIIVK